VDEVFTGGQSVREMDFPTRNLYRTAVEQLARGSGYSELEVAYAAVAAARSALAGDVAGSDGRMSDPGYFLIAGGPARLRARDRLSSAGANLAWTSVSGARHCGYVGAGALTAIVLLAIPALIAHRLAVDPWRIFLLSALSSIAAVDLAVALVNHAVTRGFAPSCCRPWT